MKISCKSAENTSGIRVGSDVLYIRCIPRKYKPAYEIAGLPLPPNLGTSQYALWFSIGAKIAKPGNIPRPVGLTPSVTEIAAHIPTTPIIQGGGRGFIDRTLHRHVGGKRGRATESSSGDARNKKLFHLIAPMDSAQAVFRMRQ